MLSHPRLTPARSDLAALSLRGVVEAARYAEPVAMEIAAPLAPLMRRPGSGLDTELLRGEVFDAYELADGWAWGQAADGYVGYVPAEALAPRGEPPTHRIAALRTHVYPEPDMKTPPVGALSYAAQLRVAAVAERFAEIAGGGFVPLPHLAPATAPAEDRVAEAERMLGLPYLWGGRSTLGLDCSALVQLTLQAAGRACPRDSDMQEAALGVTLDAGLALRRGDLVFWKGHVGIMQDETRLIHANAHHMAVASEPLAGAEERILAAGDGPVTRIARLDGIDGSG